MAAAHTTRSASTRSLCVILGLMSLVCVANSSEAKERVKEMKVQVTESERLIEQLKAKIESERKSTFEIMSGNMARMKFIREHSLAPLHKIEAMEDYTEDTNTRVKESFADMAATIQEMESRLEDMKAQVKFAERLSLESDHPMF